MEKYFDARIEILKIVFDRVILPAFEKIDSLVVLKITDQVLENVKLPVQILVEDEIEGLAMDTVGFELYENNRKIQTTPIITTPTNETTK